MTDSQAPVPGLRQRPACANSVTNESLASSARSTRQSNSDSAAGTSGPRRTADAALGLDELPPEHPTRTHSATQHGNDARTLTSLSVTRTPMRSWAPRLPGPRAGCQPVPERGTSPAHLGSSGARRLRSNRRSNRVRISTHPPEARRGPRRQHQRCDRSGSREERSIAAHAAAFGTPSEVMMVRANSGCSSPG